MAELSPLLSIPAYNSPVEFLACYQYIFQAKLPADNAAELDTL